MFAKLRCDLFALFSFVFISTSMADAGQSAGPAGRPANPTSPAQTIKTPPQTYSIWLTVGLFEVVDEPEPTQAVINELRVMTFRWGTDNPDAEEGFWRLRGASDEHSATENSLALLATGVAGSAPGGRFEIDLSQYLPPTPPREPAIYYVDIIARKKAASTAQKTRTPGSTGRYKPLVAPLILELGHWSKSFVITYVEHSASRF